MALVEAGGQHGAQGRATIPTFGCSWLSIPCGSIPRSRRRFLGSQIISTLSLGVTGNPGLSNALERKSKDWMKISRDFVQRGKNMTFRSAYEIEKMGRSTVDVKFIICFIGNTLSVTDLRLTRS
ncbi:hypothetical protein GGR53DRAFT_31293 [Hypoxylon sp. FL1150]|nr:hypothetical protein GGR53DRAFT_31293 [Hypoxylon sp. FL1150]